MPLLGRCRRPGDGVRIRRARQRGPTLRHADQERREGKHDMGRGTEHPLDNPVWHALAGPHAGVALGHGGARHYPRDMAPFSALAEATPAAYADLAADLPPGLEARLFRPAEEPAPSGWEVVSARPILQMVADA